MSPDTLFEAVFGHHLRYPPPDVLILFALMALALAVAITNPPH